jgi:asparagine synthase (glutamine-hydrolysing)
MCGISTIVTRNPDPSYRGIIEKMTGLVRHRGPDNMCIMSLLGDTIHLGHTRLSIIDLSHEADQPMCLEGSGLWILYNGEVYNYIELRADLERLGHTFRTGSDTEVILNAYQAWGADCLRRFNGMFAFTIIDTQRKRLFAARDRLGVKPLYYYHVPGQLFSIASEIKQFTALPSFRPQINPQRLYDYLAHGMLDHTRETMFGCVFQLRGGQCMEVSLDPADKAFAQPSIQTWWTLPIHSQDMSITMDEAARKFQDLLEDSVKLRLRSDVPAGSCLSGGLDSSSIVCMVNRVLGTEKSSEIQKTFSSCFEDERYDERTYIEEVIAKVRVESHYTFPDPDTLFSLLDTITWHQDEPFGSMSIFAQWQVFQLARAHGVKVMLDGQGADELLGGYHGFFWAWMAGLIRHRKLTGVIKEYRAIHERHGYHLRDALINLGHIFSPGWIRPVGRFLMGRPDTPEWIHPQITRQYALDPSSAIPEPASSVRGLSREQILNTNLPALLHYEDRNSMAHSIEARIPFLDYRLVEFVYSLPDEYKIKDGETKKVLRQAIRNIVPERIRQRQDKMGFVTPEEQWIRHTHNAQFHALMKENLGFIDPWINHSKLQDRFQSLTQGSRAFDWSIWRAINAGIWARLFHMDFRGIS